VGLNGKSVLSIASNTGGGTNDFLYAGTVSDGIFLSTDNGSNWSPVNNGITINPVNVITISGNNIFAGTDCGLYLSTNNGSSWSLTSITNNHIFSIASYDNNIIACVGVFVSLSIGNITDEGKYLDKSHLLSFASQNNSNTITYSDGVFLSSDIGKSWIPINNGLRNVGDLTCKDVYSFAINGSNIFAGTFGSGVYLSTDTGNSWSAVNSGLTRKSILSLAIRDSILFAGIYIGGVFCSINDGRSWYSVNSNLPDDYSAQSLAIIGNNLFAGTWGNGVWQRPLSEMVTGIKDPINQTPPRFMLQQNYPNPFNPSTTISFIIAERSFVSLKVFDIIGREITTIIFKELNSGSYFAKWNASNLPSGIYFYRLEAGLLSETKKLVLMK